MAEGTRTALFVRSQPGGAFAVEDMNLGTGNRFFVHSGTGVNAVGGGRNPDAPLATIDYAIGLCTASKGDIVYVMPGHAENITAADSIDCDVAGVSIIGLGYGALIPTVSATAAAGGITVDAANVTIKNIRLVANFATGCTAAINITASGDGCTLDGVQARDTTTDKEWLVHVGVATGVDDLLIRNCDFRGLAGSMTNSILFAGTSLNATIENCLIFVDSSDDVIDHLAGAAVGCVIRGCVVVNADTDAAGYCARHKSDGTGIAYLNTWAYNKVDAEVSLGAAAWWVNNIGSNTITDGGVREPAGSAAIP